MPEMAGHTPTPQEQPSLGNTPCYGLSHTIRVLGSCLSRQVSLYGWILMVKVLLLSGYFWVETNPLGDPYFILKQHFIKYASRKPSIYWMQSVLHKNILKYKRFHGPLILGTAGLNKVKQVSLQQDFQRLIL